ncbi:hypothetical protein LOTGIDRAFT_117048 [Lottia gigantea]|uniref:Peptide chain release factor domain-containing protein n=1 Tax=Lottia gigantea TaxID=225164 RepID=V4AL43_LOTGI|nr:hypothetical protein LOTGIDRAFT_117048 [Lottia gigantea]ESO95465.1 hypothetical protein LOTGIDRAFT_117048 [Lottia gigantea]
MFKSLSTFSCTFLISSYLILGSQNDKEIKQMIEDDILNCQAEIEELQKKVVKLIVGEVKTDQNDIILELSCGVGGAEAMLFTRDIFNMYIKYIQYKGWSHEVLTYDKTVEGGLRKAEIEVNGDFVFKYLKYEGGVHRVQRVPQTEKSGRIHTSTMTVAVLPQPSEIDVVIQDKDLKIQTFKSQGSGGQSVNKTDSAVRMVHLPTGTVIECQESRSQIENRAKALKYLRSRLYQKELEAQLSQVSNARKLQVGTSGRSEKIRTYNFQQDRITDHRIHVNLSHIEGFLNDGAELDSLLEDIIDYTNNQTLEALIDEYHQNLKKQGKMKK